MYGLRSEMKLRWKILEKCHFLPGGGRAVRSFFRIGVRVVIISVGVAVSKYGVQVKNSCR